MFPLGLMKICIYSSFKKSFRSVFGFIIYAGDMKFKRYNGYQCKIISFPLLSQVNQHLCLAATIVTNILGITPFTKNYVGFLFTQILFFPFQCILENVPYEHRILFNDCIVFRLWVCHLLFNWFPVLRSLDFFHSSAPTNSTH